MAIETAVLAGGCFWGMQELFRKLPGVINTEVAYVGGENQYPTYENHPGHAEAVKIDFDPSSISYREILDFFFRIHDPTTLNRQGNDVGSSYRSAIFYANDKQKKEAEDFIDLVNKKGVWGSPIVTTVEPIKNFFKAEEYHQNYLQKNPGGYTCHFVRSIPSFLT